MNPEQTVCDRELAQEMENRGLPQGGWIWYWFKNHGYFVSRKTFEDPYEDEMIFCAAPCTSELLEILPSEFINQRLNIYTDGKYWDVMYGIDQFFQEDEKLANALTKMIIHLHDHGLLDLKEVKC